MHLLDMWPSWCAGAAGLAAGLTLVALPAAQADQLIAYGQYLANECVSCHRPGAAEEGIPPIAGRNADDLMALLRLYKTGERDHGTMVSVARSLDEEQMKALTAYFATQPEK